MARDRATMQAIEAIYRRRGADYFRLAFARTSDPELAHDAVQEGFARAIRALRTFRGSGSLEAWLARCVLNAAADARRGAAIFDPGDQHDSSCPLPEPADEELRAALRSIPPRQRDALFLRHYLDLDYAAIGEALGIEVGTVSATLHAARKNLTHALQEVVR